MKRNIFILSALFLTFAITAHAWQEPGTSFSTLPAWFSGPVTGSGTSGKIPRLTGSATLGNSTISDDGASATANGNLFGLGFIDLTTAGKYLGFRGRSDEGLFEDRYGLQLMAPENLIFSIDSNGNDSSTIFAVTHDESGLYGASGLTPTNTIFKVKENGDASISGDLTVGGQSVCRADGTNCPAGSSGDITGVTAGTGLGGGGTSGSVTLNLDVPVTLANGGTGATTASGARANLGLGSLATIDSPLPVANGGTGVTTKTGTGSVVLSDSPTFSGVVQIPQIANQGGPLYLNVSKIGRDSTDVSNSLTPPYGAASAVIFGTAHAQTVAGVVGENSFPTNGGYGIYCYSVSGNCGGNRSWTVTSDARLKDNVNTITNALDKISELRGVTFHFKSDSADRQNLGFIAQEVMQVLPEAVTKDSTGYYTMTYDSVVPVLVEAVKELKAKNDDLEKRLEALEAKVK